MASDSDGVRAVNRSGLGSVEVEVGALLRLPAGAFSAVLAHEAAMQRAIKQDEDTCFLTEGGEDAPTDSRAWGCTKSGITENMAYIWAENEAALRVFEPLAMAVSDRLCPRRDGGEQHLRLLAASFIVAKPPGVRDHEARPHMDWDVNLPRQASFTFLCPLLYNNPREGDSDNWSEQVGGIEYWPLPLDRYAAPQVVKYEKGRVVVFDGLVQHRTQPFWLDNNDFPVIFGQVRGRMCLRIYHLDIPIHLPSPA
jgi:hypothetical protein